MILFINIYTSISSPLLGKVFFCIRQQPKFQQTPWHVNKALLITIRSMHHTPYHFVVNNGVVDFVAWSAGANWRGGHHYLKYKGCLTACTYLTLQQVPAALRSASLPRNTIGDCIPSEIPAIVPFSSDRSFIKACWKRSIKKRRSSSGFWTTTKFIFKMASRISWKG